MAWTVTTRSKPVHGNERAFHLALTADAATQAVETGLDYIEGFSATPGSLTTAGVKIYPNSNASGVQSNGVLGCSGFASGDQLYVTVWGR